MNKQKLNLTRENLQLGIDYSENPAELLKVAEQLEIYIYPHRNGFNFEINKEFFFSKMGDPKPFFKISEVDKKKVKSIDTFIQDLGEDNIIYMLLCDIGHNMYDVGEFEDWCYNFGYDKYVDNNKSYLNPISLDMYKACKSYNKQLQSVFRKIDCNINLDIFPS